MYINFSQFNGNFAVPLPRNQMIKSGCGAFLYMENRYHFLVRNLADGRSPNDYNISNNERDKTLLFRASSIWKNESADSMESSAKVAVSKSVSCYESYKSWPNEAKKIRNILL